MGDKGGQSADAVSTRTAQIAGILNESVGHGLVLDFKNRLILVSGRMEGSVRCTFQHGGCYGTVIHYDNELNFSIIKYAQKQSNEFPDAPPLSGVHLADESDIEVVTSSLGKVSILPGKFRFTENGRVGEGTVSYSVNEAQAARGSPVLSMDGTIVAIVTGTESRGIDQFLSVSIPLAVSRHILSGAQGRGNTYIGCHAGEGASQHNGDVFVSYSGGNT